LATVTYISYYDAITESKARGFIQACAEAIAQTKPGQLYFLFSSNGGSVDAGITVYNYLRALPIPTVMHNTGTIASTANVVFLAGTERYAAPHSSFLLHGLKWGFPQPVELTWNQLQETESAFRGAESLFTSILKERTSLTDAELTALLHQGETKDLAFAKAKGIIQDIRPVKIAPGAPFFALNLQ
jgi:ATP-dependent protease ClpP protease subunit